jgi:malonyl-CoA O-methyltransferase
LYPNGRLLINELHPFKQYEGSKARFEKNGKSLRVDAFVHHISDFTSAASDKNLKLVKLNEYWHEEDDESTPPRLVSFIFEKSVD